MSGLEDIKLFTNNVTLLHFKSSRSFTVLDNSSIKMKLEALEVYTSFPGLDDVNVR